MSQIGKFFLILLLIMIGCAPQEDRRIQLGKRPLEAIARERVRTVKIAVDEKKKTAILSFKNDTGQNELDWLRQGLAEMIALNLAQSRQLNLTPSRNVAETLARDRLQPEDVADAARCRRLAGDLGAQALITGRFFFNDDSLRVEAVLRDGLSGEVLLDLAGACGDLNMRTLFRTMLPLARRIRSVLEEKAEPSAPEHLSFEATTASLEAYRRYMDGMTLFDSYLFADAAESFRQAIALDTTFASAYMRLGICLLLLGDESAARPLLRRAQTFADRLTERERLPILAMNARIAKDFPKAVELYNQFIALYPEDPMGHFQLGEHYFIVASDYLKAIEYLETAISLDAELKSAYNMLAYCYAFIGESEHAYDALEKCIELSPNDPNPYDSYGEILHREGRIREAIAKYQLALKKNHAFYPAKFHLAIAYVDLGRINRARRSLDKIHRHAANAFEKRVSTQLLILTEITAGNSAQAQRLAERVRSGGDDELWSLDVLLRLSPTSEAYRRRFLEIIEQEKMRISDEDYASDRIFTLVAIALEHQLGVPQVRDLLNDLVKSEPSPVLYHIAMAYLTVFQLYDFGSREELPIVLPERIIEPQIFQYTNPPPWNYYWKFYFQAAMQAAERGLDIEAWVAGFREFAELSQSPYMKAQALLASAAAKYAVGAATAAQRILADQGFPDEGDWTFIGPFDMHGGFDQTFWPEQRSVDDWWTNSAALPQVFQSRDRIPDGYVNLKEIADTQLGQAVYAVLPVYSPSVLKARLHVGMNGRLKMWLNDEPVWVINDHRPAVIDRYSQPVRLRPGVNLLMMRLDSAIGELGFYFRITDFRGRPNAEITFGQPPTAAQILTTKQE